MEKIWPEIVLTSSKDWHAQNIRRAVAAKKLRKIAPRIYTSNLVDEPEQIIKKNRHQLLGLLFPGAVISHRSALEGGISPSGIVILTYKYTRTIQLPGFTIRLIKGPGPDPEDTPFLNLYISSRARAFLENLTPTRTREDFSKSLTQDELEQRLDRMVRIYGQEELNLLRDQAKRVSQRLEMQKAYSRWDQIIGALLGTKSETHLKTEFGKARSLGIPYDPRRVELFATLSSCIHQLEHTSLPSKVTTPQALINQAFFEAYFSNYIEGTEFAIEEAEKIIFENKIFSNRPKESHDVLSTYQMISDRRLMQTVPQSDAELISYLKQRHSRLMAERQELSPGKFKDVMNRVGNTIFVKPEEVVGTLDKGFQLYQQLKPGFPRAIFLMFLISEVHPFLDGNGRIARIMMNAELDSSNECRIIIPTVYRDDYLSTLRRLSREHDPAPFIRMMLRAQKFTHSIQVEEYHQALMQFRAANAFLEPSEGKLLF